MPHNCTEHNYKTNQSYHEKAEKYFSAIYIKDVNPNSEYKNVCNIVSSFFVIMVLQIQIRLISQ